MNETTKAVRGVGAEVRKVGFCWMGVVKHLGGGGTDYYKFNGRWVPTFQSDIPSAVYRALRAELRKNIATALGR